MADQWAGRRHRIVTSAADLVGVRWEPLVLPRSYVCRHGPVEVETEESEVRPLEVLLIIAIVGAFCVRHTSQGRSVDTGVGLQRQDAKRPILITGDPLPIMPARSQRQGSRSTPQGMIGLSTSSPSARHLGAFRGLRSTPPRAEPAVARWASLRPTPDGTAVAGHTRALCQLGPA